MSERRHSSVASATAWANRALLDYVRDNGVAEVDKTAVADAVDTFNYLREGHNSPAFYLMLATLSEHFVVTMLGVAGYVKDIRDMTGDDPSSDGVRDVVDIFLDAIEWPDFGSPEIVARSYAARASELRDSLCELMADLASECIRVHGSTGVGDILEGGRGCGYFHDLSYEDENMRILAAVRASHAALYDAVEGDAS